MLNQTFKHKMKKSFKAIQKFIQKEWFLLVTIAAIATIILLFELF